MILAFSIVVIVCSLILTLLVLLHKGRGGGLSDLFGGGVSSSLGGSSVAERNLDRITIGVGLIWFAAIVALGLAHGAGSDTAATNGASSTSHAQYSSFGSKRVPFRRPS